MLFSLHKIAPDRPARKPVEVHYLEVRQYRRKPPPTPARKSRYFAYFLFAASRLRETKILDFRPKLPVSDAFAPTAISPFETTGFRRLRLAALLFPVF
jgi:hypothetical protein